MHTTCKATSNLAITRLSLTTFFQDDLILSRTLYKLFHIEEAIERNTREIKEQSRTLASLRLEASKSSDALTASISSQAQSRILVSKQEKKIRKAEKALEDKKPDMTDIEAKIKHSERKLEKAEKIKNEVERSRDELQIKLSKMKKELMKVRKDADEAQGKSQQSQPHFNL